MNTIYSYGSIDAIKLVSLMQKENYSAAKNHKTQNEQRMISVYILLATQIKYDVTSVVVSPKYWFEMRFNDFTTNQHKFAEANNQWVDELNLNKSFKI